MSARAVGSSTTRTSETVCITSNFNWKKKADQRNKEKLMAKKKGKKKSKKKDKKSKKKKKK